MYVRRSLSGATFLFALFTLMMAPMGLQGQVLLGVETGLNFSKATGDDINSGAANRRTGLVLGGTLEAPISGVFGFKAGLRIIEKGTDEKVEEFDATTALNYLEIPLLLNLDISGPEERGGLSVFAGPSVAFKLTCEVSVKDPSEDITVSTGCQDFAKTLELGLIFGAGVSIPTRGPTIDFNAGVGLGQTSFDDEFDVKNSGFFMTTGLKWQVGG